MVPTTDSASYLTPITNKRKIVPKLIPNSESSNSIETFCVNHSNCFKTKTLKPSNIKTSSYKNNFMIGTPSKTTPHVPIQLRASSQLSQVATDPIALSRRITPAVVTALYPYRYRYSTLTSVGSLFGPVMFSADPFRPTLFGPVLIWKVGRKVPNWG